MIAKRRTDLALEAHSLARAAAKSEELEGVVAHERREFDCTLTRIDITSEAGAAAVGKPEGRYVTLALRSGADTAFSRRAAILARELRSLMPRDLESALVVGLGNADMTADALGPLTAAQILVTRHLKKEPAFRALTAVSALRPGVLGKTGLEAAELVRAATAAVRPAVVIAVDALAAQDTSRLCRTVQLSNSGIVPGSGVGNHRAALDQKTLGVPVISLGVPTVVEAGTLARDLLEGAGQALDEDALPARDALFVTPRDIDAEVRALAQLLGRSINLALQPRLSPEDLDALTL